MRWEERHFCSGTCSRIAGHRALVQAFLKGLQGAWGTGFSSLSPQRAESQFCRARHGPNAAGPLRMTPAAAIFKILPPKDFLTFSKINDRASGKKRVNASTRWRGLAVVRSSGKSVQRHFEEMPPAGHRRGVCGRPCLRHLGRSAAGLDSALCRERLRGAAPKYPASLLKKA